MDDNILAYNDLTTLWICVHFIGGGPPESLPTNQLARKEVSWTAGESL